MEKEQNANNNTNNNDEKTLDEVISELNNNNITEEAVKVDLEAAIAVLKDQLLRSAAELDNVRKRSEKQVEEASKYAISGFIKDLVSVTENLYRILENINQEEVLENKSLKTVADGLDLTLRELTTVCERSGVKRIKPAIGDEFDHNIHQAVSYVDSAENKAGSVIQVMQAGYMIKDRLINPAIVAVVKDS
jgi:molecular chaperone GrpE